MAPSRPTQEQVDVAVEDRLRRDPATITTLIEEMVTGPSEAQVRRAAWRLLYDASRADLDRDLRIVVRAKVEHIHCSSMGCSNDSSGGAVATVEFDGGVRVPLCQPCLARSGLGVVMNEDDPRHGLPLKRTS